MRLILIFFLKNKILPTLSNSTIVFFRTTNSSLPQQRLSFKTYTVNVLPFSLSLSLFSKVSRDSLYNLLFKISRFCFQQRFSWNFGKTQYRNRLWRVYRCSSNVVYRCLKLTDSEKNPFFTLLLSLSLSISSQKCHVTLFIIFYSKFQDFVFSKDFHGTLEKLNIETDFGESIDVLLM